MNYKYYDEKYANFLLKKCLVNDDARPLAIMYKGKALEPFALVCLWQARKLGFKKIYLYNIKCITFHNTEILFFLIQ